MPLYLHLYLGRACPTGGHVLGKLYNSTAVFLTSFSYNGWALNNLPNLQKVNKELPFSYYMPYETILMVTGFYEKQAPFHSLQTALYLDILSSQYFGDG